MDDFAYTILIKHLEANCLTVALEDITTKLPLLNAYQLVEVFEILHPPKPLPEDQAKHRVRLLVAVGKYI